MFTRCCALGSEGTNPSLTQKPALNLPHGTGWREHTKLHPDSHSNLLYNPIISTVPAAFWVYGQLGVGKVCLETRNTLGKVETSSLIWGFYQCKGKGLVLPRFLTDHNCSSNVFWANFHICFAPHSLPTFHFPSFTEFYISSWFSAQLVQTPQFRKASFCTEVLGLFFFSISF